ncbi:hypothetical protein KKI24_22745 [bacterium]|nr:hypothetical protein [bacterium]
MKTSKNDASALKKLLWEKKAATMSDLKSALDTDVNMTVFRKLKELSYITSCSHSGRYYTLSDIPDFDKDGLWQYNSIIFSIHGTLLNTVKAFIDGSQSGYTVGELKRILKVDVKEPLLTLFRKKQLYRKKVLDRYVYFAADPQIKKHQLLHRSEQQSETTVSVEYGIDQSLPDKIKKSIWLFFSTLNEKQRRWYAGLESLKMGYGGDKAMASLFGIDPHTVAKGRSELLSESIDMQRVRKKGAGRRPVEKKARKS